MEELQDALQSAEQAVRLCLGDERVAFQEAVARVEADDVAGRVWRREGNLWSEAPGAVEAIENLLGWLDLPDSMRVEVPRLTMLALEVEAARMESVVLLGMGGSSLAPEVMQRILGNGDDHPRLTVLDTTDPDQIRRVEAQVPLERTLFLAASKSGTTAETRNLLTYFYHRMEQVVGEQEAARHFVIVTDPGTELSQLGREKDFRAVYINPHDVGGRYSALSLFGLVPAAVIGLDLDELLERGRLMARRCEPEREAERNPGLMLGTVLGALASQPQGKRDKLTILSSPKLAPFVDWVEQLIAESTGKRVEMPQETGVERVGILPVEDEGLADVDRYGNDRLFVYLRLADDANAALDARVAELSQSGQPLVVQHWEDVYDLGAAFFLWEFAVAVAGRIMGINPFNQPNVDAAKEQARAALRQYEQTRELPERQPVLIDEPLVLYGPEYDADDASAYLADFLGQAQPHDYVALMAYIDRCAAYDEMLCALRHDLAQGLRLAVTRGFGPRFLHSTGQLHKGGPNNGLFVQIVRQEEKDLEIPGRSYSFGILKQAQALGDLNALQAANRRVMRVMVGRDVMAGLEALKGAIETALTQFEAAG